ncbi:MAG: allantoin permease [Sulfobacillus acidophilus]|uniref:Allantoin permease n=1 Tax=Sulfobacillus acidophilus TaxID=53633 RepID=A0A2T2WH46_9FIRM|nr:MAG: allantoin permease [Sulfobacillus acidophilus]
MLMWTGDGVNMGNMAIGGSMVVLGVATLNLPQSIIAMVVTITLIAFIFVFNDRAGYKLGIPYPMQLKISFGDKGNAISSLLRGVPAIIWYGIQTWIGGTALNEVLKIATGNAFNNVAICFVGLMVAQIVLSIFKFRSIKWVTALATVVIMAALVYIFVLLLKDYSGVIVSKWVDAKGSWGVTFFGFIMVLLGNYAAIFLSAADYSRELKPGIKNTKRFFIYFTPIILSYGFVIMVGVMLASATGITNPASAIAAVVKDPVITIITSVFIVIATLSTNMVANIVTPTYVIQLLSRSKLNYKVAVTITGLLAMVSFPWLLDAQRSARGLDDFVLIYSAFLGPILAVLLVEYYFLRRQHVDVSDLYQVHGVFSGYNPNALIAIGIGALFAFMFVQLAWIIGLVTAGISYYLLMKYAFHDSRFKLGTVFQSKSADTPMDRR